MISSLATWFRRRRVIDSMVGILLTQRMAAAQLRFLGVFGLQFVSDAVQQRDVALLWVLLQGGYEGP